MMEDVLEYCFALNIQLLLRRAGDCHHAAGAGSRADAECQVSLAAVHQSEKRATDQLSLIHI